jgi:hypothetical protein
MPASFAKRQTTELLRRSNIALQLLSEDEHTKLDALPGWMIGWTLTMLKGGVRAACSHP